MDKPGFITPPPNLIPPRHDTGTHTQKAPARRKDIPAFIPGGGATAVPAATPPAVQTPSKQWRLRLPNGSVLTLDGALLLGRDPVHFEPWTTATLVKLDDPAKSVSKTHAALEVRDGDLVITDLHSTNGIVVADRHGHENELESGGSTAMASDAAGSTVYLGSFALRAERV